MVLIGCVVLDMCMVILFVVFKLDADIDESANGLRVWAWVSRWWIEGVPGGGEWGPLS